MTTRGFGGFGGLSKEELDRRLSLKKSRKRFRDHCFKDHCFTRTVTTTPNS